MKLDNTAAIITGGASGLGAATAAALADQGATVYAFDLAASIEKATRSDDQVKGVVYVEVDVTSPEQVEAAVAQAASGVEPLRTVVTARASARRRASSARAASTTSASTPRSSRST